MLARKVRQTCLTCFTIYVFSLVLVWVSVMSRVTHVPNEVYPVPMSTGSFPNLDDSWHGGIFYFAITHPTSVEGEIACRETWAKHLNVTWYSSEKTFPDTIVVSAEPNTYMNIFARVIKVWAHVYKEHKGYDWYVRLWPDNFVYGDRLLQLLDSYNPESPQLIGRVGIHGMYKFVGGGAGWALSRAAFENWVQRDGNSLEGCKQPEGLSDDLMFAEDVITSTCLTKANVRLVQRGDVFLSHPHDHEDNSKLTPEEFKNVVTMHYTDPSQIYQVWRDINRSRRFAVISVAASAQHDNYTFLVPFAVAAWKMLGWSTVIIIVGTQYEMHSFISSFEDVIKEIDTSSYFIFVESLPAQKVTVSQISRLFPATADWIEPEDVILITDVDLLPVCPDTYDTIARSKTMTILNADCCGAFLYNGMSIPMQPMSNIIGTKRDWLLLMNISESSQLSVSYINEWLTSHNMDRIPRTQAVKGENEQWYLDQRVLSVRLALTELKLNKVTRNTANDRIDRLFPDT